MPKLLLMYSGLVPSAPHVERLRAMRDDCVVAVAKSEAEALAHAPDTDIILGHRYLRQTLPHTHMLQWIQSTAAGVDHLVSPELLRIQPLLTRCPIFGEEIAWHAWALVLALVRRLPAAHTAQIGGRWAPAEVHPLPYPRRAMVLGMGVIGQHLGCLLRHNGLYVIGVNRSPRDDARRACDLLVDARNWRKHLPEADVLFSTLPYTRATDRILDAATLRMLPAHAVVVNVGRGGTIDTSALTTLLRAGALGGAALDVVDPLPGPEEVDFWATPNLLITPKVATFVPDRQEKLERFFEEQVERFLKGEAPAYTVRLDHLSIEAVA
jgi:phosphoglycerate dehydrogenase-like enzyme